ncbi:AAA family ATPase [Nocardia transvalensis]|uniref:AAA family ATPase n=1 Tax=Nocardia transvalensis TaxID=37333 RepID=UPI0018953D72|nr:AAA family ATPase [Nocardia transvalensis]MBF6333953.1 AAA family ATPase [Nocardia transvalensis]
MRAYIDESFRRPVRAHLLANLLSDVPTYPLILGVFGPPGEGKTFQVERICEELGLRQHLLSPGELESENAGAPGQLLRREYLAAGETTEDGRRGILVIHDIDTILGNWGSLVQYTVNRQVVYAQLMAFCDFPTTVAGNPAARVPIVVTGNNPSILYGPLLRPGRMRTIRWQPTGSMRARIVSYMFPGVDPREVAELVAVYRDRPVSFWADVHALIIENRVMDAIDSIGPPRIKAVLSNGSRIRVPSEVRSIDDLANAAKHLAQADIRSVDYLEK